MANSERARPPEPDDLDGELAVVREEGLSKNPIRNRMVMDVAPLQTDDLTEIVARARDFFHSFIGQTVRRRYKRPPIYLVDGWVTTALGYFTTARSRSSHGVSSQRSLALPGSSTSRGIGTVYELFNALDAFLRVMDGLAVLKVQDRQSLLRARCIEVLGVLNGSVAMDAGSLIDTLRGDAMLVQQHLKRHPTLREEVSEPYFKRVNDTAERLQQALERFARSAPPEVDSVSFDASRHGGLLLVSIPELDIEGPAIILAPANIAGWASGMPIDAKKVLPPFDDAARLWLGARRPDHLPFAVALGNVLQHEMTHGMLRLANDVPEGEDQEQSQNKQYRHYPLFEEGLANFIACLTTASAVLKCEEAVTGPGLPVLGGPKYRKRYDGLRPLIAWTFAGYHEESTEAFLRAWEGNARNVKAFAGLCAMFATDHAKTNWEDTYRALKDGVVSTTKERSSRASG